MSSSKLSSLQTELIGTFLEEAFEGLAQLEGGLLALQNHADPGSLVDDIFRAAHSIKGGAGTFGFDDVTEVAHSLETLLDHWRDGALITDNAIRLSLEAVDALRTQLNAVRKGVPFDASAHAALRKQLLDSASAARASLPPPAPAVSKAPPARARWQIAFRPLPHLARTGNDPALLLRELHALGHAEVVADGSGMPGWSELDPESFHLAFHVTLDTSASETEIRDVFSWVDGDCELAIERADASVPAPIESPVPAAAATAPGPPEAPEPEPAGRPSAKAPQRRDSAPDADAAVASLRVSVEKIDMLMNMVGELVITQSMLGVLDHDGPVSVERLSRIREGLGQLARNTRTLQESVMRLRSTPIGAVFGRFPRLVHDISRRMGKEIELRISGESTELDKTVLEKLGDPLVHLVRNSLDHGLETPEERVAAGKPRVGTLRLNAAHRGGDIVVEVADDGRGLDLARILAKARAQKLVADDQQLSDAEIRNLIFVAGFSTADQVSDISGRGVGMDVVRRNVKALGGSLSVDSTPGAGTTVSLRLPLTLAIVDGQLVRIGGRTYVIPLLAIVESVEVQPRLVHRLAGQHQLYRLRDDYIPMVDLGSLLGIAPRPQTPHQLMVIVEGDGERVGLLVEDLHGQQQVVIKSLEANYQPIAGLSGATILGDGDVALIIDVVGIGQLVRGQRGRSSIGHLERSDQAAE